MNKQNVTLKRAMLEALEKSLGVVTTAANIVGITRKTHYDWMQKDPKYAQSVADIENVTLDFAESQLHKQVKSGNTSATIFLLKTKGKKRGYIERQEITHQGGIPITKISNEAIEQIDEILDKEY
jgi:hypothetical protein